ncbi:MAG: hypothetical protein ACHBN1_16865 [Heteroscytonema crispum UTEX LB 1556]
MVRQRRQEGVSTPLAELGETPRPQWRTIHDWRTPSGFTIAGTRETLPRARSDPGGIFPPADFAPLHHQPPTNNHYL